MPKKRNNIAPMLAKIGSEKNLEQLGYVFEPKLDGIRGICLVNHIIIMHSRTGRDITQQFPELYFRKNIIAKSCVLDGEIVVYNKKGVPDFNLLQNNGQQARFVVFDILEKNGKSLYNTPLLQRRKILEETVQEGERIDIIPQTTEGKKLWTLSKKYAFEGVVAKKKDGLYYPGQRTGEWLKIKHFKSIDCVIIGYTQEKRLISALALGVYDKNKLCYIGKVGTGFNQKEIIQLHSKLEKIKTKKNFIPETEVKGIIAVKPIMVCEIKYYEVTNYMRLRKPVFMRLRTDKKPKDCTLSSQTDLVTGF